MNKNLDINVGHGPHEKKLRRIVLDLLATERYNENIYMDQAQSDVILHTSYYNGKYQLTGWDEQRSSTSSGKDYIDAATEFGRLIELLEEKPQIKIDHITDAYEHGIVSEDKQSIKIGCRTVRKEKVKEVYEAMFK